MRGEKRVFTGIGGGLLLLGFLVSSLWAEEKPVSAKGKSGRDDSTVVVSQKSRIRLGGISIGAGYSHFSGPYYPYGYWYPHPYYPYWGTLWDSYYYSPYYMSFYPDFSTSRGPGRGEIRVQTDQKGAEVYLNGAYAGRVGDLKKFYLQPGAYDLEIKTPDNKVFQKRLYVLSGKTLKIFPVFVASRAEEER
jgi:hypothetical protein